MGRAPCCEKEKVKKGPWSPEEDEKLKSYIHLHGAVSNWIALPHKIGLKRCGKSCRLRWLNYLRPNIKHGGFSEEEDNIICSLFISIGSRWSIIAAQLPGRTDNDIKNYWNTRLKKKLLGTPKQYFSNINKLSSHGNYRDTAQALTNSGIERLQLQMQLHQSTFSFNNASTLWPPMPVGEVKVARTGQLANHNHVDGASCRVGTPMLEGYAMNCRSMKSPTVSSSSTELGRLEGGGGRGGVEFVKGMDGSKESLYWWGYDFDAKSGGATKLWETAASVDVQLEEIFKEFEQFSHSL
ncbi:transcription factor MYB36 [Cucumis sativus]|nr:transcription factor MYB36 [Cucumis sativus]KAE8651654.1 hypothetical protein Csa_021239 [Cucumis sativus]